MASSDSQDRPRAEQILDAAATLFARRGYADTHIDQLAEAAGVSKGLVYFYFPSKEAILEAVIERAVRAWGEATLAGVALAGAGTTDGIRAAVRSSVAYAAQDPILRGILAHDPRLLMKQHLNRGDELVELYVALLIPVLERGVASGELRADLSVEETADAIWMVHDALVRELFIAPTRKRPADPTPLTEALLELVLDGLRART